MVITNNRVHVYKRPMVDGKEATCLWVPHFCSNSVAFVLCTAKGGFEGSDPTVKLMVVY